MARKRLFGVILFAIVLFSSSTCSAFAAESNSQTEKNAQALEQLGLLQGDKLGYSLDRQSTRLEGLVLFTRLIGQEDQALAYTTYTHPFTDVAAWGDGYVENAYVNGIAKGMTATEFGAKSYMTAPQYMTFLLRALGYDDQAGDFSWRNSLDKSLEIGLLTKDQHTRLQKGTMLRGDMVDIAYQTLDHPAKGEGNTIIQQLVGQKVVTKTQAEKAGFKLSSTNTTTTSNSKTSKEGVSKSLDIPHYLQTDPRWKDFEIAPGSTMERSGCAYTAVVMAHAYLEDDSSIDPLTFYDSSYFTGANIIWSKVGFETRTNPDTEEELWQTIFDEIEGGRPVIILGLKGYGTHYVIINGYQDVVLDKKGQPQNLERSNFTILDPSGLATDLEAFFTLYPQIGDGRYYMK